LILVVDDQPVNLRLLAEILDHQFAVLVATNGADALTLARRAPYPDVILLDVMMPEMDGYAVCAALKRDPLTANIPVIFVTARTDAPSETRALAQGAVDFITKPINPTLVRMRIRLQLRLRQREEALRESKQQLEIALEAAAMGIWNYDIATGCLSLTERQAALLGLGVERRVLRLRALKPLIDPRDRRRCLANLHRALRGDLPFDQSYRVIWPNGARHWLHSVGKLTYDERGAAHRLVGTSRDICDIKSHEAQLESLAHSDVLTGLPNRRRLRERIGHAIATIDRGGQRLALVYLDLDGFKPINDTHGHDIGDRFLIALARRLQATIREVDTLARLGGDEFAAVMVDQEDDQDCLILLERLLAAAAAPLTINGLQLSVTASMGVTFYPQNGCADPDGLLSQADAAMYQAKAAGKNRYCIFTPSTADA
jgi:diguanylate cyclase (GGDEF)-like protein